jgi:hypothetical protein
MLGLLGLASSFGRQDEEGWCGQGGRCLLWTRSGSGMHHVHAKSTEIGGELGVNVCMGASRREPGIP